MVLPFLALSLIARGVMPDLGTEGQLVLVLCTADGPMEMTISSATGQQAPSGQGDDPRCHWAQADMSLALLSTPELALLKSGAARVTPATQTTRWRPAYDPRGLWARAPPQIL